MSGTALLLPLPAPAIWAVFGTFVGSFLNVAIHRYGIEGQSVWSPRRSSCPRCGHSLAWYENLPILSWLALRARCRACRAPISWRYPLVEALTGALWWVAATAGGPDSAVIGVRVAVFSGLIVATFVDLDCFEIPDSVSLGGMALAPVCALLVPALHADSPLARALSDDPSAIGPLGALSASLAGMATGGGVLLAVAWLGSRTFGRDAMGLGDVKLLAAGGGFVGAGGVLLALMVASVLASAAGVANIARFFCLVRSRARARGGRRGAGAALRIARLAGRYLPFGPYLATGIGITLVYWNDVLTLVLRGRG
ncbi:MAG: prepilin peptidase [Planctomycetota bacterium]|nr:prepilin peptidase [Planctomycetota bacterium]MDP6990652.1 prepilin peptidase [Planctomycetota bacterium]